MQSATISAHFQACLNDMRRRAYVFLNIDNLSILSFAAWLCESRAALVQVGSSLELVESMWDFNLEDVDSGVAAGFFAACETEVKHRGYLGLKGFADACNFQTLFYEEFEDSRSCLRRMMVKLLTIAYKWFLGEQALQSVIGRVPWNPNLQCGGEGDQPAEQGQKNYKEQGNKEVSHERYRR